MSERDAADRRAAIRARLETLIERLQLRVIGERQMKRRNGPRQSAAVLLSFTEVGDIAALLQQADADAATIAQLRAFVEKQWESHMEYGPHCDRLPECETCQQFQAALGTVPHA